MSHLFVNLKIGQSIWIGNVKVMLCDIQRETAKYHQAPKARLGFEAPKDVKILRKELLRTTDGCR